MRFMKPVYLYALGWVLLVLGVVVYVNTVTGATVDCVYRAQRQDSTITSTRSDAAERRDDALVRSKLTMGRIVELRIYDDRAKDDKELAALFEKYLPGHGENYSDLQALSRMYVTTVLDYVSAQHELDTVRDKNPPPNIKKMCG